MPKRSRPQRTPMPSTASSWSVAKRRSPGGTAGQPMVEDAQPVNERTTMVVTAPSVAIANSLATLCSERTGSMPRKLVCFVFRAQLRTGSDAAAH